VTHGHKAINLYGKYALQELMELKQTKIKMAFQSQTMGVFVLLIILLSFAAGAIRREMVLTLTGAVFLAVWVYCLVMTLLLALLHHKRAGRISIRLGLEKIVAGEWTHVIFSPFLQGEKYLQLPLILVRCRILLKTKDGRYVEYDFKPEETGFSQLNTFQVNGRGAYFCTYDEFAIFDILGFFRFAFRIPAENTNNARLLVSPCSAGEPFPVRAMGGETDRQDAPALERTDDLADNRPYVPGDDPRRINWKLYSHGGELFIRQGEREPPPQSNITMLIDTQYDMLYTKKSARLAVDLLCETALAVIADISKNKNVQLGFSGQSCKSPTPAELRSFLAYPYAQGKDLQQINNLDLPPVTEKCAIIILALPRTTSEPSALDRFLANNTNREIELVFVYSTENLRRAEKERAEAETCAALYNKRPGVKAWTIGS
jgi:hypothetical protein